MEELFVKLFAKGGIAIIAGIFGLIGTLLATFRDAAGKKNIKVQTSKTDFLVDGTTIAPQQAKKIVEALGKTSDSIDG